MYQVTVLTQQQHYFLQIPIAFSNSLASVMANRLILNLLEGGDTTSPKTLTIETMLQFHHDPVASVLDYVEVE